jgi:hypothetical protein
MFTVVYFMPPRSRDHIFITYRAKLLDANWLMKQGFFSVIRGRITRRRGKFFFFLRDSGNFKALKTLVKLILNFTRPHTITYTYRYIYRCCTRGVIALHHVKRTRQLLSRLK